MLWRSFMVPCPELTKYIDVYQHGYGDVEPIAQDSLPGQILAVAMEYWLSGITADKVIDMISSDLDDLSSHEVESFGEVFSTIIDLTSPFRDMYCMSVRNSINELRAKQIMYRSYLKLVDPNTLELYIVIG